MKLLKEQQQYLHETIQLLHKQLKSILSEGSDPRYRVALAELLQSYAVLHKTLLDVEKAQVELPYKVLDYKKKQKELEALTSGDINLFKLQEVLISLGLVSIGTPNREDMNKLAYESGKQVEEVREDEEKKEV